ncbi:MAG: hypothetical protein J5482_02225 [Oscillospiraceae bacterium]|nr:hypothetical protein [Oscillospiraceae bacterium]
MQNIYKRLQQAEAMANAQKDEMMETLQAAYNRAVEAENEEDAATYARKIRNKLLEESDARMTIDRLGLIVPSGSSFTAWLSFLRGLGDVLLGSWAKYRQALRDLTEQAGFPLDIQFPTKPDED